MKLSKETLEILSSVRNINAGSTFQGAIFKKGNIIKARRNRHMPILKAVIEEEFPRDFAIYDLKKFLSMFSLLDQPELEFAEDHVKFTSGKKTAKIKYAAEHLIEDPNFYSIEAKLPSTDIEFDLSEEDFKYLKVSASSFGSPEISFQSDGEKIYASTFNISDKGADIARIEVGESDKVFNIIISLEYLQFLSRSYKVSISFKGIIEFNSGNLSYWVTCSDKSKVS